jgi:signal transduction histidine kinase
MAAAVTRRRTIIASLAAAVLLIAASLISTAGQLLDPRTFVLSLVVIAAAAIGDSTRSRRSYLEAALERAARAEETRDAEARRRVAEERLRIARDLHDAVGHRMTVINLHAAVATNLLRDDPDEAARSLTIIGESARTVLAEIHELLKVLRSDEGARETSGAVGMAGLPALVDDIEKTGTTVAVRRTGRVPTLDRQRDAVAYRVLQESLVNARRHGSGATIEVHLHGGPDAYELTVVNETDERPPRPEGHGLRGMRERVEAAGGSMVSGPVDGRFEVAVRLPVRAGVRLESP